MVPERRDERPGVGVCAQGYESAGLTTTRTRRAGGRIFPWAPISPVRSTAPGAAPGTAAPTRPRSALHDDPGGSGHPTVARYGPTVLVVAVLSLKGGVGKTTVALGLAGAAQQHGLRTLVVDLDPQANATVALDPGPTTADVAELLDDPSASVLARALARSRWGEGLDVLVGAEETERHDHPDPGPEQLSSLARALDHLRVRSGAVDTSGMSDVSQATGGPSGAEITAGNGGLGNGGAGNGGMRTGGTARLGRIGTAGSPDDAPDRAGDRAGLQGGPSGPPYRLVIVDCPPSLGRLTRSGLTAAHRAILVTDPTMFAVSGVQRAFDAVQRERQRSNPDLQPLGVLINRVRPRNTEHQFRIEELRELFGPLVFSSQLPDRSAIQQSQGACLPVQQWDTPGAREASQVFTALLGRVLRSERSAQGRRALSPTGT
jgi:chromosome partitioning protein